MSENQESRADRVARYKEERRRQLAAQFGSHQDPTASRTRSKDATSSSSEGPRPTRASKLRAAAALSQDNLSSQNQGIKLHNSEKIPTSSIGGNESRNVGSRRVERDKSSKRKSNLNRSLNSEEVPPADFSDDAKNRRRRRRFFPPEVLEQSTKDLSDDKNRSDTNHTATYIPKPSPSPNTASSPTPRTPPKKSELRIHMENARKGVTPSFCEMGKYKPFAKRAVTSSPRSPRSFNTSPQNLSQENSFSRISNKENMKSKDVIKQHSVSDNDDNGSKNIARRMEELTAFTRQTLARVERLANKNRESPKREMSRPLTSSPIRQINHRTANKTSRKSPCLEKSVPSSILKKKSIDETPIIIEELAPIQCSTSGPVSILKRKVSQDDHNKSEGGLHSSNNTPPVTFSPSVVEPTTTKRKQGILKKRRSLDESTVMRHRSCSPEIAVKADSRSILKNQRRSSLEELRRTRSPEAQLQGILKRKSSKNEEDDQSLNSPQSILKRRSGASSAGSITSTPHVSITTAVILAAAGGAEIVLEPEGEPVKPILKKKSFSEEHFYYNESSSDVPKPILKKKSSTETDDSEERPKKPILKMPRSSLEREILDTGQESRIFSSYKHTSSSETDCEVRPILKQTSREEPPRPRLSFCGGSTSLEEEEVIRRRTSRRSHTICTDFNVRTLNIDTKEEDRLLRKPRPLSVHELVMSFEKTTSTGAIPKRTNGKRNNDRYRTQPVTSNELEASLNLVKSPQFNEDHQNNHSNLSNSSRSFDIHSLLDFTSSLENDAHLNNFFSSTLHNPTSPESVAYGKMSSDSAFQSLGDGLELEQEDDHSQDVRESTKTRGKLEPSKLEMQMKAIAEEAKKMKLGKGNAGIDRYRTRKTGITERLPTRFSTQPVTFEEVQEASRITKNDEGDSEDDIEVEKSPERKSILKSATDSSTRRRTRSPTAPKSALKKRDSTNGSPSRRSILKTETSPDKDDEGISCDNSDSDSDNSAAHASYGAKEDTKTKSAFSDRRVAGRYGKVNGDSTSEGESSGGREIRSIFKNDNRLCFKETLESVLSKSRSQGTFGNATTEIAPKKTVNIRRSHTQNEMPRTIAALRDKLKERGESEWRKRVPQSNNATDELKLLKEKNRYNDELSEKSLLAAKKDELDAAAKQWKARVEKSDAEKFSVAGKMGEKIRDAIPTINIPTSDNKKRTPQAKRFKLKDGIAGSESTPTSPEKTGIFDLTRSKSVPYPPIADNDSSGSESTRASGRKVAVPKPDDFTFATFFKSVEQTTNAESVDLSLEDFDAIQRQSLLVIKKNVQMQKRRGATGNPIKALASRTDIANEYTEVITGVAEREKRRLNIEKLAKNSNKALEALAGLASNEDFKSIALKKFSGPTQHLPWKDLMLLQIKGRRHVQTRLVEPVASSINEGDNFILITPTALYNYIGAYSNVIEQSRAADIANHIQKSADMGCKVDKIITISHKTSSPKQVSDFWKLLGANEAPEIIGAGHPDEDGTYESNILHTNMIYTLDGDELVPHDKYWGSIPKIEMLQETSILVFDFGSELYVWSGKNAPLDKKIQTLKLAKTMWQEGYNYTECNICPLNIASILGAREQEELPRKAEQRPEWALFAKITQHRETVLFREKFLDWPDFSRVIRVRSSDDIKDVSASYDIKPCNVKEMLEAKEKDPDIVIENTHLGRGDKYFDEETRRLFEYDTLKIKAWRILENTHEELKDQSIGQFYDGDSYIYSWMYRQTVKGRELTGKPSKHAQVGRDRCIFFCWHGNNSSINEKCTAAFLTVELDKQNAPQVRVVQGSEPAAFLRLFNGGMVIHNGKRDEAENSQEPRLFMVRGEVENEIYLMEVPLSMSSLRSRSSFVIIDTEGKQVTIWHGAKSSKQKRKVIKNTVYKVMKNKPAELYLDEFKEDLHVVEMDEGSESEDFFDVIGNSREEYVSLLNCEESYDHTLRLFRMSSVTGNFVATEVLCPHRSEYSSPYPFVQSELYSASQPGLFLIDNHHELWLWQGWWPEKDDEIDLSDQTGSGAVRWQAERKGAMQTAINYWKATHEEDEPVVAHLVWAGLEPLSFKNLFPTWDEREDVAELNEKEGKVPGEIRPLEKELALLSRTTYPLTDLLQRPLPEGVDPTNIEKYLSPGDFEELLSMSKEEFEKLPSWKKTALKKEKGLF